LSEVSNGNPKLIKAFAEVEMKKINAAQTHSSSRDVFWGQMKKAA